MKIIRHLEVSWSGTAAPVADVRRALENLPDSAQVGFRVYGGEARESPIITMIASYEDELTEPEPSKSDASTDR